MGEAAKATDFGGLQRILLSIYVGSSRSGHFPFQAVPLNLSEAESACMKL